MLRMLMLGNVSVSSTVLHHLHIIEDIVSSVFFNNKGLIPKGLAAVLLILLMIHLMSLMEKCTSVTQSISLGKSSSDQA